MVKRFIIFLALGIAVATGLVVSKVIEPFGAMAMSMTEMVRENSELRSALTNLTTESAIGYAKVIDQNTVKGFTSTTIKFVAVDRDDPTRIILERTHTIRGDVFYFDLLVVRFAPELVADGEERALYLWRRVFGSGEAPETGMVIEQPGSQPQRYQAISSALGIDGAELFWNEMWALSNKPDRLAELGISAVEGRATYRKVKPGLIYTFKMNNAGGITSSITPDL
ncbi:MAG: hypothetical protein PF961_06650 [Planctomycetota bacterium]|jgi:hypothetical protein|nr:hypothetical protein [Planctomycetota bacterium]